MKQIEDFPRFSLSSWPTPIEPLSGLSAALGGPKIFLKRDDMGSLAFGGNKLRKLEFLVGEAKKLGCDVLVTSGAIQSNHARLTVAAAAKAGLACRLVLKDEVPGRAPAYFRSANRFLDHLLGAEVEIVTRDAPLADAVDACVEKLRGRGLSPYVIPVGGSNPVGCLGYVACAEEIARQQADAGVPFDHIVVVSGSGGTHAGLAVGCRYAGLGARLVGIPISRPAEGQRAIVADIAERTAALLDMPAEGLGDALRFDDGYYLPGYGEPNAAMVEAVTLTARSEGILLDPVYTGKAMAALIGAIRRGDFGSDERILFIHTGGAPGLFAYEEVFG